jgi:hypothetical protein
LLDFALGHYRSGRCLVGKCECSRKLRNRKLLDRLKQCVGSLRGRAGARYQRDHQRELEEVGLEPEGADVSGTRLKGSARCVLAQSSTSNSGTDTFDSFASDLVASYRYEADKSQAPCSSD